MVVLSQRDVRSVDAEVLASRRTRVLLQPPIVLKDVSQRIGVHSAPVLLDRPPNGLGVRGEEHGAHVDELVAQRELRSNRGPIEPVGALQRSVLCCSIQQPGRGAHRPGSQRQT